MWQPNFITCLLVLTLFTGLGCAGGTDAPQTVRVTGKVTFDGQPVAHGEILFESADGQGQSDAAPITAGSYTAHVTHGEKKVSIKSTVESPEKAADGMPNFVELIPAKYNTATELKARISSSHKNPLDFELTK